LNETSAIVYLACGNQSFQDLKSKHNFTDDLIYLALDKLAANDLIEDYRSDHFAGLSRRDVIRKVRLATMAALPVTAVAIPSAADAASLTASQRTSCRDGLVGPNGGCNPHTGCAALGAGICLLFRSQYLCLLSCWCLYWQWRSNCGA
jgi:hypothetical protein